MFGTFTKPIIYHINKSQSSLSLVQLKSFQEHKHLNHQFAIEGVKWRFEIQNNTERDTEVHIQK